MKMSKLAMGLGALLAALAVAVPGMFRPGSGVALAARNDGIIGKWSPLSGLIPIEFKQDGTVVIGNSVGKYHFVDDSHVRIQVKSDMRVQTVDLSGDTLVLKPEGGSGVESYLRVQNTAAPKASPTKGKAGAENWEEYFIPAPGVKLHFVRLKLNPNGEIVSRGTETAAFGTPGVPDIPKIPDFAKGKKLIPFTWEFGMDGKDRSYKFYLLSSDEGVETVAAETTDANGKTVVMTDPERRFSVKFPVQPGDTWEFMNKTLEGVTYRVAVTVEEVNDTVTVPLGTFEKCVRIDQRFTTPDGKPQAAYSIWYARGIGRIKTCQYASGDPNRGDVSVVSVLDRVDH